MNKKMVVAIGLALSAGKGSLFAVRIPLSDERPASEAPRAQPLRLQQRLPKVVVVDADVDARESLSEGFSSPVIGLKSR